MNKRKCFICNSISGITYGKKKIDVIEIGKITLGFKVCSNCGLLLQDPVVPETIMGKYYKHIVDYTNSGDSGKPKKIKIDAVKAQKKFVYKYLKDNSRILQIGSSDGYTLSQFKTKKNYTVGVEPSISSCKFARSKYVIDKIICSKLENCHKKLSKFNLIILTHVIEHIYNPVKVLKLLKSKLYEDGIILIEVPYLSNIEYLPNGYLTFEHLNYFDRKSILNTVRKAGFNLIGKIDVDLKHDVYPIQRLLIKKNKNIQNFNFKSKKNFKRNKIIMNKYQIKDDNIFKKMIKKIINKTNNKNFIVWGAGIHSSLLFTNQKKIRSKISFYVDSDKKKWGKYLYGKKVFSPKFFFKNFKKNSLVTSTISENQINTVLKKKFFKNKIINLYGK